MRLVDNLKTTAGARALVTIFVASGLAACGTTGSADLAPVSAMPGNGPQADYPILVGEPYEIAGTLHTPADVLNYDEVGYLTLDPDTAGFSGAHHSLPVPSYAEVTSLETGRTVLVRLERRGPMTTNHLIALSPAAMAQLGGSVEMPVRVRRVNPPEVQRAMLRAGEAAPLRMDTPTSLLTVLQRRLPSSGSASLATKAEAPTAIETVELAASSAASSEAEVSPAPAPDAATPEEVEVVAVASAVETEELASVEPAAQEQANQFAAAFESASAEPSADPAAEPEQAASPAPDAEGSFLVQAAAFASQDNARRAAKSLGGAISQSGRYYQVRTGPFMTRGEAEASLANVHRAGYSDARILTSG
ncbi:SPOR domain-containing protein [Aurantiacibacter rhizosphaerae]|uniref:SPOR domain-containing protein n=1 Tax=Aurantiacibacter rhizosphaerae TaxID=2691582 RepID=A0A844XED5_9SPHN|nr:SPOR domain-containing protein [Aurantiacibacter rhizosphaerae]MWV28032.1 hypothetical protein [Aurantiacibacter rhizosphaerae]